MKTKKSLVLSRYSAFLISPVWDGVMYYISIEEGNINNNDDKMMLVSYIYSKLDIIDYSKYIDSICHYCKCCSK